MSAASCLLILQYLGELLKIVSSGGSHPKVNIKSVMEAQWLLFSIIKNRMLIFVIEFSCGFTFVLYILLSITGLIANGAVAFKEHTNDSH